MTSAAPHRTPATSAGPSIARRMERVSPFLAMDVLSAAAAKERRGDSVVHMEVGQPSAPAPRPRGKRPRRPSKRPIGYTEALGIAPLRERIARHYRRYVRRRRRARAGGRDDRLLGRLRPRLPRACSTRARGGDHGAGLSGLSQHPRGPRPRAGDDPARRGRRLGHDGGGGRSALTPRRRSPASSP